MRTPINQLNSHINSFMVGGKYGFEFIRVDLLAHKLNTSEVGLRFFLGVVSGVPFAIIYLFLTKLSPGKKHFYFAFTGLLINYFCFGSDCIYNLFSIIVSFAATTWLGPTLKNVIFAFIFHTVYLSVGYLMNETDNYDVKWTTPQCILCLRLIGLAWDFYDGHQDESTLSNDQKETQIKDYPTFMQICGFSFCFCGFLGGPQFSFSRYLKFTSNTLIPVDAFQKSPSRFTEAIKRVLGAITMTAIFIQLESIYRCDHLIEQSFLEKPFLEKVVVMGLVYYSQFLKYVIVWWFSESICMLVGLSYNGYDESGHPSWVGLRNFKLRQFLTGAYFQDIIESFNINTNQWVGRYLFRRLRFLGSKYASHAITLLYLSVWHGFYIGYLVMFVLEFMQITAERQYRNAFGKYFNINLKELPILQRALLQLVGAIYKWLACGFYVQAFMLLRWRKTKIAFASVYYWPIVVMAIWYIVLAPIMSLLNKRKTRLEKELRKSEKTE